MISPDPRATLILNLQWYQELHNRRFHHDIYVLSKMRKVSHLVHHLSKYINAEEVSDNLLVDIFACTLSIASALNIDIGKTVGEDYTGLFNQCVFTKRYYHFFTTLIWDVFSTQKEVEHA